MNKSKKGGQRKDDESAITNKDELHAMPMDKTTDKGRRVAETGDVGEVEGDNTTGFKHEPKADSQSGQWSDGDSKAPSRNIVYAVMDKSHEKI